MGARNEEFTVVWQGCWRTFGEGEQRVEIGDVRFTDGSFLKAKIRVQEKELLEGGSYIFFGRIIQHHTHGKQLHVNSWVEVKPIDEDSLISYLMMAKGKRGGMTRRIAGLLYEEFGLNAIDVLIDDPAKACSEIPRWSADKASIASKVLKSQDHKRHAKLEMIRLCEGRGFPKQTPDRAIKEWGINAARKVLADPYILMKLPGIGFKAADKFYCEMAREHSRSDREYIDALSDIRRQGLCAAYKVGSDRSGSTWVQEGVAFAGVNESITSTEAKPKEAIQWCVQNDKLVRRSLNGDWVARSNMALEEQLVANFLANNEESIVEWPDTEGLNWYAPEGKDLSEHQLAAISAATEGVVGCLQGSPGVGKTFCVACIVKAIIDTHGHRAIAVACPTGKAAVRAKQALLENGVEMETTTIHRLLGVVGTTGGSWQFGHNSEMPLPQRFIIIDETSMCDTTLMASLLNACTSFTHILFVGDVNQLAPVGHGRPFEDMQKLTPTGHLTEIRRNSGRIVQCCAEIRDEQKFRPNTQGETSELNNLPLIHASDPDAQRVLLETLINRIGQGDKDADEVWDVQVVTALNDRTEVSRKPLNLMLQQTLNPEGYRVKGNKFRVGDKAVCLKNGSYMDVENKEVNHFVANGELAEVVALRLGIMTLRLWEPDRTIFIPHAIHTESTSIEDNDEQAKGAISDWDLGYALSVHRSQGSQWKYVIVVVDGSGSAAAVQSRNWLYTAISRAEKVTFVLGKQSDCDRMMPRDGTSRRKTFLVEQVEGLRAFHAIDYDAAFAEVRQ